MDIFRRADLEEMRRRILEAEPVRQPLVQRIEAFMARVTDRLEVHWPFTLVAAVLWCLVAGPIYLACAVYAAFHDE